MSLTVLQKTGCLGDWLSEVQGCNWGTSSLGTGVNHLNISRFGQSCSWETALAL